MEFRQLRYFVAVAESGSFSRASQRLFVAQPALSVQVRALEESVGRPLFVRHRRGVAPTPAGTAFLEDARRTLALYESALARVRGELSAAHRLRFGMVPSATQTLLPGIARRLRRAHPGLLVEAREMPTQQQIDGLREGTLDFCFGRPPKGDASVSASIRHDDPYCLAVPADHPAAGGRRIRLADVAQESFVSFGRDRGANYFDRTIAMCLESGFSPRIHHEASTFSSALGMVSAGLGVSIIPASCILLAHRGVRVLALPRSRHRSMLALLAPGRARHPLHDAVLAAATREFRVVFSKVATALA